MGIEKTTCFTSFLDLHSSRIRVYGVSINEAEDGLSDFQGSKEAAHTGTELVHFLWQATPYPESGRPLELVKWQDVVKTEELVFSFLKELDSEAINRLVRK